RSVRWCYAYEKRRSTRFTSATCTVPPTPVPRCSRSSLHTTFVPPPWMQWRVNSLTGCLPTSACLNPMHIAGKAEDTGNGLLGAYFKCRKWGKKQVDSSGPWPTGKIETRKELRLLHRIYAALCNSLR